MLRKGEEVTLFDIPFPNTFTIKYDQPASFGSCLKNIYFCLSKIP